MNVDDISKTPTAGGTIASTYFGIISEVWRMQQLLRHCAAACIKDIYGCNAFLTPLSPMEAWLTRHLAVYHLVREVSVITHGGKMVEIIEPARHQDSPPTPHGDAKVIQFPNRKHA